MHKERWWCGINYAVKLSPTGKRDDGTYQKILWEAKFEPILKTSLGYKSVKRIDRLLHENGWDVLKQFWGYDSIVNILHEDNEEEIFIGADIVPVYPDSIQMLDAVYPHENFMYWRGIFRWTIYSEEGNTINSYKKYYKEYPSDYILYRLKEGDINTGYCAYNGYGFSVYEWEPIISGFKFTNVLREDNLPTGEFDDWGGNYYESGYYKGYYPVADQIILDSIEIYPLSFLPYCYPVAIINESQRITFELTDKETNEKQKIEDVKEKKDKRRLNFALGPYKTLYTEAIKTELEIGKASKIVGRKRVVASGNFINYQYPQSRSYEIIRDGYYTYSSFNGYSYEETDNGFVETKEDEQYIQKREFDIRGEIKVCGIRER